jgi:16S rRNA (adenine1518-N6/adenine1519-N6)-dimethyltransferase
LFHLLAQSAALLDLHIMLQREVVVRMAAQPGGKDYGRLTVMLTPGFQIERLFDVGPGAFRPPPKVWSAVVRISTRPVPLFAVSPHFAALVAAAFSQRRKTLRNALSGLLSREAIVACGIDPGARAETLTPEAFNTLAQTLDRAPR